MGAVGYPSTEVWERLLQVKGMNQGIVKFSAELGGMESVDAWGHMNLCTWVQMACECDWPQR